jgi:hypothetical protein
VFRVQRQRLKLESERAREKETYRETGGRLREAERQQILKERAGAGNRGRESESRFQEREHSLSTNRERVLD